MSRRKAQSCPPRTSCDEQEVRGRFQTRHLSGQLDCFASGRKDPEHPRPPANQNPGSGTRAEQSAPRNAGDEHDLRGGRSIPICHQTCKKHTQVMQSVQQRTGRIHTLAPYPAVRGPACALCAAWLVYMFAVWTSDWYNLTRVTRWFIKSDVSPSERQDGRRQPGTRFILFTNMMHFVQHVCEQETISSARPAAYRAVRPGTCLVRNRTRTSGHVIDASLGGSRGRSRSFWKKWR
jgi:hypothetical protein